MRTRLLALLVALVAETSASAGTTICTDGTTSTAERGACSHHGGVAKHTERTRAKKHAQTRDREAQPRRTQRRSRAHEQLEPREQPDVQWAEPRHEHHPIEKQEAITPTAVCVDGDVSYALNHRGACSGHGGVQKWLDQ